MRLWRPTLHARAGDACRGLGEQRSESSFHYIYMLLNMVCTDLLKDCVLVLILTAAHSLVRGLAIALMISLPVPLQRIVASLLGLRTLYEFQIRMHHS